MFEVAAQPIQLTLYTDAFVIRGVVLTRQRRVSDVLNDTEYDFLVVSDAVMDEFGTHTQSVRSDFAQVNLASVLFAVAESSIPASPELRTPKASELALIAVPPFRISGRIHLLPGRDLGQALGELTGRFLPVTDATYWSEVVGEARQSADMVAVNHARAQLLAPYREADPWAGLERGAGNESVRAGEGPADLG